MRNANKKLKKILIMTEIFVISIYTKVLAVVWPDKIGPETTTIQALPSWWGTIRDRIIPFIFCIGIIIYWKKSSSNIIKKIILTAILMIVIFLLCLGITEFVTVEIVTYK